MGHHHYCHSVFKDQDIVTFTLPSTAAKQKYQKKMMQSAGGQTLSTIISKNPNPESGTEPAGTSHDEIGFQSCFTSQQRTINKLPDLFFLAFLNCIDSNHLLIISLLGFEIKNKNNLFGNNIQILRIYMYEIV